MKRTVIAGCAVLALVLFVSPAFAGDLVKLKGGRWLVSEPANDPPETEDFEASAITVTAENYDKLVYTVELPNGRTTKQEYEAAKVEEVFYYPKPQNWLDAAEAMEAGQYQDAAKAFSNLTANRSSRTWIRVYSYTNLARIHEALGNWNDAIQAWNGLLKDFPKSKFAPTAHIQIGLAYMNLGDVNSAKASFGKLGRMSGLPEGQKGLAKYYVILIKQKQGEQSGNKALIGQAESEYRQLLSSVEGESEQAEVATLARLGIGDCMVLLGKTNDALDYFKKIAAVSDDSFVLAGAFNGLGQCYFKQEKWQDALKAFLRVEILYDVHPEKTAMALFFSGRCFQFMEGAGLGVESADRARGQYRKCMSRFGGSSWGRQAQAVITSVRSSRSK